jgi:N-acetylmuramoyl-L-alanine amidase
MYALWYPSTNSGQGAVVANSGATIGGQFAVRVVVQPNSGSIITASVIHQSITEQTNAHPVSAGHLAEFEVASANPQYGDPVQNVIVLQSPFVNLAGHNGTYQIQVTVRYVTGPIPFHYGVYEETATMTLTMSNLVLVDSRTEPYIVWKPGEMTGVVFSAQLQHAQAGTCTVKVEIFRTEDNQNPIFVRQFDGVSRPGSWSWTWDGKLADGSIAPRGVYTYRLSALAYVPTLPDSDSNRSDSLRITQTRLEVSEDRRLWFRYYLSEAGSDGFVLAFDPSPQEVIMWDVGVATNAGWNSLEVALPPTEESPPGSIRYLALIRDWGDANGMDKAHRSRWALPLNSTIPVVGVIIDAGHGQDPQGKGDPGAVHGGVKEADVNWAYAWILRSKFVQDHPFLTTPAWCNLFALVAYKTYFLRNGNEHIPVTYPDGSEGPRMRRLRRFIKQYKPRILASLHCNAHPNPDLRGVEVLWRHNIDLAWCICVRLFQSLTQQEAPRIELIERNDLRLLSLGDRIASCIVELGYLSNQQDRQQLLSSQYRHKQCGAIHIGCDDYN